MVFLPVENTRCILSLNIEAEEALLRPHVMLMENKGPFQVEVVIPFGCCASCMQGTLTSQSAWGEERQDASPAPGKGNRGHEESQGF